MRITQNTVMALVMLGVLAGTSQLALAYTSPNGKTTLGAKMYADFSDKTVKTDGQKVGPTGYGVDVKRFYFTVNHEFNNLWSVRMRTDFYTGGPQSGDLYLKQAYVQAKLSKAFVVSIGENDMPWIPFSEQMYGLRYIEHTLADRSGVGHAADWGLHIRGASLDGLIRYNLAIVNGAGYHVPNRRTDAMDFAGRIDLKVIPGLHTALGFYSGKLGNDAYGPASFTVNNATYVVPANAKVPTRTASRWDALIAWIQPRYRVGASYFSAKNWHTVNEITSPRGDKADGFSIWGDLDVAPKWMLFARYDHVKPEKDLNPNLTDQYFNAGVQYQAISHVQIALVFKHEKVSHGFFDTANGTIGGSDHGTYNEVGIWTQVAF